MQNNADFKWLSYEWFHHVRIMFLTAIPGIEQPFQENCNNSREDFGQKIKLAEIERKNLFPK